MHTSPAGGKIEFTARIRYSWKTFRAFRSPRMTGGASIELRESAARYSSEIEPGPPRITFPTKAAAPWYKSSIFRSLRDTYNKFERTRPREKRRFLKKKKKKKKENVTHLFLQNDRFRRSLDRTIPRIRGNSRAKRKQFYRRASRKMSNPYIPWFHARGRKERGGEILDSFGTDFTRVGSGNPGRSTK